MHSCPTIVVAALSRFPHRNLVDFIAFLALDHFLCALINSPDRWPRMEAGEELSWRKQKGKSY